MDQHNICADWKILFLSDWMCDFKMYVISDYWSEMILVVSNITCAAQSFEFEISPMISDQNAFC